MSPHEIMMKSSLWNFAIYRGGRGNILTLTQADMRMSSLCDGREWTGLEMTYIVSVGR